jgi:IMP dehydrogenase/GMP reductase
MIIENKVGYAYNDVTIVPSTSSSVKSRSDINPFTNNNRLPIFTAPMSTVVNCENFSMWEDNKITPILPRNIDWKTRLEYIKNHKWVAVSLSEFEQIENDLDNFILPRDPNNPYYLCIDIANGHMNHLLNACFRVKYKYGDTVIIMTGNIANPETIHLYEQSLVDYVRVGIGGGAGCTTTSNVAIHYPQASLINDINKLVKYTNHHTKIIADGGIRNFSDVNKALALGADYVMIGGLFASFLESAGNLISEYSNVKIEDGDLIIQNKIHSDDISLAKYHVQDTWGNYYSEIKKYITITKHEADDYFYYSCNTRIPLWNNTFPEHLKRHLIKTHNIIKEFYGMSTKKAQELIKSNSKKRTSEGTSKEYKVNYTMKQWVDNMEAYLRSCMSYCNCRTLEDFIGNQNLIVNSTSEIAAVNK